jgi:hypothetical protein
MDWIERIIQFAIDDELGICNLRIFSHLKAEMHVHPGPSFQNADGIGYPMYSGY